MSLAQKSSSLLFSLALLFGASAHATTETVTQVVPENPVKWQLSGKLKTGDSFYAANYSMLNNNIPYDRVFYIRNTLDVKGMLAYLDIAQLCFEMRNKCFWGTSDIIPDTVTPIKTLDVVASPHRHYFPRNVLWMRSAWLGVSLNEALGLSFFDKRQTMMLGAFPFELGRGIALGNAYSVGPDYLGFYTDDMVDQYAFGGKLAGELAGDWLAYDLYCAMLNNQSYNLSKTGEKIMGQEYGRLNNAERGFGKINFVWAGRLKITAVESKKQGKLTFEPYFLYNSDPEQRVDFPADSSSTLGTLGLAGEYVGENFECGFDTAFNRGAQEVKGWDRNTIQFQNINGEMVEVNSHVYVNMDPTSSAAASVKNKNAYKLPQITSAITLPTAANPGLVSGVGSVASGFVNGAVQDSANNGKSIGIAVSTDTNPNGGGKVTTQLSDVAIIPVPLTDAVTNGQLFNAKNRFRDPYINNYRGWMFVADAAYYFCEHTLCVAGTAGYATGDEDPNHELEDGDYDGFIGLQEQYSGKRVQSAYVLGGASKLKFPLSVPTSGSGQPNRLAGLTSGFTNLALIGAGVTWKPADWKKSFSINPNLLLYWQAYPSNKFDLATKTILPYPSRSFLGTEINVFIRKELMKSLEIFGTGSVFVPGSHFKDVKGKPMNELQWRILDRLDRTGYNGDKAPGISNDVSYTMNIGLEYKF